MSWWLKKYCEPSSNFTFLAALSQLLQAGGPWYSAKPCHSYTDPTSGSWTGANLRPTTLPSWMILRSSEVLPRLAGVSISSSGIRRGTVETSGDRWGTVHSHRWGCLWKMVLYASQMWKMVFYASFLQKLYCMLNFLQQLYCMPHFLKMVLHVSFLKVGFACLIFYGVVMLIFCMLM